MIDELEGIVRSGQKNLKGFLKTCKFQGNVGNQQFYESEKYLILCENTSQGVEVTEAYPSQNYEFMMDNIRHEYKRLIQATGGKQE